MAMLWITTIGFLIVIGLAAGIFIFALRTALPSKDSIEVDEVSKDENVHL
ncbi:hypothetical protein [Cytobacillus purgationiresistens]|uniref:Uncharacterized protein n=1 Tax=Cytobacillus purgationiresistens TaxID=863449 RepID=A0ABU0AJR3_9BACI|nr:hypothetical protein [Cytobacillus purgationiresistens]MDQ0271501.1 hypothetical protein [Cytobacillus purgationiresistens]